MPDLPFGFFLLFLPLLGSLFTFFHKRLKIKLTNEIQIFLYTAMWCVYLGLLGGYYYYQKFVEIKTNPPTLVSDKVLAAEDPDVEAPNWYKLMEEYLVRGTWDTSAFRPINNALCTKTSKDISKYMWRTEEIPILSKSIGIKFYILDQRENKEDPMFFILAFRVKSPNTGKYETQVSRFSVPVDGKTDRLEVMTYLNDNNQLDFVNNPGNLQQPIEEATQVQLSYTPDLQGSYLTQLYEILYNPVGDNDSYIPTDLKPYILDSLPFANLNNELVQIGFGITVGGCIQDLEYYIER